MSDPRERYRLIESKRAGASPITDTSADIAELVGQRNYEAFVEASRELLPPVVQTWSEMHPRVRQAWMKAAQAVLNAPQY
jgi:hypothetical protein